MARENESTTTVLQLNTINMGFVHNIEEESTQNWSKTGHV